MARIPIPSIALQVDDNGQVVFATDDNGVLDAVPIYDDAEVIQAIRLLLRTRLGEDLLHPTMGLPLDVMLAVGDPNYIAGAVARAILVDDRIASVKNVVVDIDHHLRKATVSLIVVLKNGNTVEVEETLGA